GYRRWRESDATQAVARWVHRDALTGLPDRVVFQERLQAALEGGRSGCVAVLVLDVDRFRLVNASYGNRGGDEVLASLAERLHAVLGPEELVQRLRAALRLGQFRLRYQPLVSTGDGRMVGVEALLRWEDPLRGQVQPDDFIPQLEESGLIVPVGAWVLDEACRQLATWRR